MNKPLISIVIPVYNGKKYLQKTLVSIAEQTYINFEVLLVDDSSTDGSFDVISEFSKQDKRFYVYRKPNGGMVSKTLNFIKPQLKGDFYFYLSQDDLLSKDILEKMVNRQIETQATTIIPDMEMYYENNINNIQYIGVKGNRNTILTGKEAFLHLLNQKIHGFALVKMELFKKYQFPEDAFDSDDFITRLWYLDSTKIAFSEGTFYYRQDNENAITKKFEKKNFYQLNSTKRLFNLITENSSLKELHFFAYKSLAYHYYHMRKKFKSFTFKNNSDSVEIAIFFSSFKKKFFTFNYILTCFKFSILKLDFKFFILIFVILLQNFIKPFSGK